MEGNNIIDPPNDDGEIILIKPSLIMENISFHAVLIRSPDNSIFLVLTPKV